MLSHYTTKELAGMAGLPSTPNGVRIMAMRKGWSSQRREGTKAREYCFDVLPTETQTALIASSFNNAVAESAPLLAPKVSVQPTICSRIATLENLLLAACGEIYELKRLMGGNHA